MAADGESFQLGRVLGRTFGGIASNALVLFAFSFAIILVPTIVTMHSLSALQASSGGGIAEFQTIMANAGNTLLASLLTALAGAFVQSGVAHALDNWEDYEPASFGDCLTAGIRYFLPMFGLNLVWGLAVGLGLVLLIIPGVFLIVIWSASVPALVNEGTGVGGAFTRSAALTKGHRLEILISLIVFMIIHVTLGFVLEGFSLGGAGEMVKSGVVVATVLQLISQTILPVILTSFLCSLHRELVLIEEGGGARGLANVFA
jgi:hypothetical protein